MYRHDTKDKIEIDKEVLQKVVSYSSPQVIGHGEYVVCQGDVGQHLYLVIKGDFNVFTNQKMKDGKIINVSEKVGKLTYGDYFGEVALLHDC